MTSLVPKVCGIYSKVAVCMIEHSFCHHCWFNFKFKASCMCVCLWCFSFWKCRVECWVKNSATGTKFGNRHKTQQLALYLSFWWGWCLIGTPYRKSKLDGPLVVLNIKRVKFCKKVLKQIYVFDEHVKNLVTDVTKQGEHEMPAATVALWMYNYVGTTI